MTTSDTQVLKELSATFTRTKPSYGPEWPAKARTVITERPWYVANSAAVLTAVKAIKGGRDGYLQAISTEGWAKFMLIKEAQDHANGAAARALDELLRLTRDVSTTSHVYAHVLDFGLPEDFVVSEEDGLESVRAPDSELGGKFREWVEAVRESKREPEPHCARMTRLLELRNGAKGHSHALELIRSKANTEQVQVVRRLLAELEAIVVSAEDQLSALDVLHIACKKLNAGDGVIPAGLKAEYQAAKKQDAEAGLQKREHEYAFEDTILDRAIAKLPEAKQRAWKAFFDEPAGTVKDEEIRAMLRDLKPCLCGSFGDPDLRACVVSGSVAAFCAKGQEIANS
jgi:hypothetical protein